MLDRFKLMIVQKEKILHDFQVQVEVEDFQSPQNMFVGVQEIREDRSALASRCKSIAMISSIYSDK